MSERTSDDLLNNKTESETVIAMMDRLRTLFDERWPKTPEADRIKSVARELAHNEGYGDYLDYMVMGIPNRDMATVPTLARCGYGTVALMFPIQPCWATYVHKAREAIAACDGAAAKPAGV